MKIKRRFAIVFLQKKLLSEKMKIRNYKHTQAYLNGISKTWFTLLISWSDFKCHEAYMNPSYRLILSLWLGLDLKQLPLTKKTRGFLLVLSSHSTWIWLISVGNAYALL